jgi:hypothetical protein
MAAGTFRGRVPKLRNIFGEILSPVATWDAQHRISDYSREVSAPRAACPALSSLSPDLAKFFLNVNAVYTYARKCLFNDAVTCNDNNPSVVDAWVWSTDGIILTRGKNEVIGEKPVPVPLRQPQIRHGLAWNRTLASMVTNPWPTARAMNIQ